MARYEYNILVGKSEGKSPLGLRPRYRRDCDIEIDLKEIGGECVAWVHLDQHRAQWRVLANTVMYLRVLLHGVSWSVIWLLP